MKPALLLVSLSTLALAGCMEKPSLGSYAAEVTATTTTDRLSPLLPVPRIEGAGRLVSVRHGGGGDRASDTYVFEGTEGVAGENRLDVSTGDEPGAANRAGSFSRVTQTDIEGELEASFPGVSMTIASGSLGSPAGELGYATGQRGATQCLYAWQNTAPERPSLITNLAGMRSQLIEVRLRLCGTVPQSRLQAAAATLSFSSGGAPVFADTRPSSLLADEGSLSPERDPEPRRPTTARRAAARHRVVQAHRARPKASSGSDSAAQRTLPADQGQTVPLPDDVATGTRVIPASAPAGRPAGLSGQVNDLPMPKG